jgi:acyl carrier protein
MHNQQYDAIFRELFSLSESRLDETLLYQSVEGWDSVGHMELISRLEEAFSINIDMDDVIDFSSYLTGKKILSKYGVKFDEQS